MPRGSRIALIRLVCRILCHIVGVPAHRRQSSLFEHESVKGGTGDLFARRHARGISDVGMTTVALQGTLAPKGNRLQPGHGEIGNLLDDSPIDDSPIDDSSVSALRVPAISVGPHPLRAPVRTTRHTAGTNSACC